MAITKKLADQTYVVETTKEIIYTPQTLTEEQKAAARENVGVSWENLPNKPFGEEIALGDTLTWDGNTDGLYSVADIYYRVSDAVPTLDDFANGAEMSFTNVGNVHSIELPYEAVLEFYSDWGCAGGEGIIIVPYDGFELQGIAVPKAGVYFNQEVEGHYVSGLTIPGYGKFEGVSIKTIDDKFIPDTIARKEEITGAVNTSLNRTNAVNAANTNYTTYMARGESLNSSETNPTVNGTIAWTYE